MMTIQLYDPMGIPTEKVLGKVVGTPTATSGPLWRATIKRPDGTTMPGFIKKQPPQQIAAE